MLSQSFSSSLLCKTVKKKKGIGETALSQCPLLKLHKKEIEFNWLVSQTAQNIWELSKN